MRFPIVIAAVLAAVCAHAASTRDEARSAYVVAQRAYAAGQFDTAREILEHVTALDPDCARCVHLLGKSYGRLAEQAGWAEAMSLARKTRSALEQAVALAPEDTLAVADLIKYYRAAPAFLGGSAEKADALERRLRDLGVDFAS